MSLIPCLVSKAALCFSRSWTTPVMSTSKIVLTCAEVRFEADRRGSLTAGRIERDLQGGLAAGALKTPAAFLGGRPTDLSELKRSGL